MKLACSTDKPTAGRDLLVRAEAEPGELVAVAVLVVAGVGGGRPQAGTETAGLPTGLLHRGVPAGGLGHGPTVGVFVPALLPSLSRAGLALVSHPGRGEPHLSQSPGVVIESVSRGRAQVSDCRAAVVVHPLLPRRAVGHDGPVQPGLEHEPEGVVLAALRRHPSVVSQPEPVGQLESLNLIN